MEAFNAMGEDGWRFALKDGDAYFFIREVDDYYEDDEGQEE